MKKLIALFVVMLFAASFAFATDDYDSGICSGEAEAEFFCVPVLTCGGDIDLGDFFTDPTHTPIPLVPLPPRVIFTLTGDDDANYIMQLTDPVTNPPDPDGPTLKGQWYYQSLTYGPTNLWWGTGLANGPWPVTGEAAGIDCDDAATFGFQPETIIPGDDPGMFTFTVTVHITATI
jgi:hypothetical protein